MTDGLATYTDPAFDRSLLTPHTNTHKHTKIQTSTHTSANRSSSAVLLPPPWYFLQQHGASTAKSMRLMHVVWWTGRRQQHRRHSWLSSAEKHARKRGGADDWMFHMDAMPGCVSRHPPASATDSRCGSTDTLSQKANCRRRKASRFHCLTRPLAAFQRHSSMPSSAALSHLLDSVWHHHSDPPRKPPCKPDRRSLLLPEETRIRRLLQLYADSELHRLNRPEVLQVATADSFFCPPLYEDLPTVLRHAPARVAFRLRLRPAHPLTGQRMKTCAASCMQPILSGASERVLGVAAAVMRRGRLQVPTRTTRFDHPENTQPLSLTAIILGLTAQWSRAVVQSRAGDHGGRDGAGEFLWCVSLPGWCTCFTAIPLAAHALMPPCLQCSFTARSRSSHAGARARLRKLPRR